MIWNQTDAYMRIRAEITAQGLVGCYSSRDSLNRLKVGHEGFDTYRANPYYHKYDVVHMPDTAKKSGDKIVFGIEYYNIPYGNTSPFIVVQYETKDGEPLLIVYFDLRRDVVKEVAASQSAEESVKSLESIKGRNLEESVQILFAGIRQNRAA